MSMLRPGDEHLHYSDSSHRWIAPPDIDQKVWDAGVRAHLFLHLTTMGGPVQSERLSDCRLPHAAPRPTSAPPAAARPTPVPQAVPRIPRPRPSAPSPDVPAVRRPAAKVRQLPRAS